MKTFLLPLLFLMSCSSVTPKVTFQPLENQNIGNDIGVSFPGSYHYVINNNDAKIYLTNTKSYSFNDKIKEDGSGFDEFKGLSQDFSIYYNFNIGNLYLINALPTTLIQTFCYNSQGKELGRYPIKNHFKGLSNSQQEYNGICVGYEKHEILYILNVYHDILGEPHYIKYPITIK